MSFLLSDNARLVRESIQAFKQLCSGEPFSFPKVVFPHDEVTIPYLAPLWPGSSKKNAFPITFTRFLPLRTRSLPQLNKYRLKDCRLLFIACTEKHSFAMTFCLY